MPLTLLLRLPGPGQQDGEWLSVDATGASSGAVQSGSLQAAAAAARGHRVVVLAPATQILLADPELPPGSGAKLARAIPFALEEQLTEDIDQLCFAVGKRSARGTTAVAVVSRELLRGWIAMLAAVGIDPVALYADIALLPDNPGQTVVWVEGDRLSLRRPASQPMTIEMTPLPEAMTVTGLIASDAPNADLRPAESVLLYLTQTDWERVRDEIEPLQMLFASLNVQILADGPLPWFARNLTATDAVNLLQGDFARATDYGSHFRAWRTAALLAALLLFTHVAVQALQIRHANRDTAAADEEIARIFSATLPAEKALDPRRQMQAQLERIRKLGGGPQTFLHMTQAIGGALGAGPQLTIEALNFHDQTLDMRLSAANVDALSSLTQAVSRQGFTAEIQSSTPTGDRVEAHVQLRTPHPGSK
jgi:general secretion pathway protein L